MANFQSGIIERGTKKNLSPRRKSNSWPPFSLFYHFVGESNIESPRQRPTDEQGILPYKNSCSSYKFGLEYEFEC